jgi:methyltransferase family protein
MLAAVWRRLPPGLRALVPGPLKAWLRRGAPKRRARRGGYASGDYWAERSELLYYQYFRFIVRCVGHDARSMADVGSGNCPYLDWFDWIPERVSIDLRTPYRSAAVQGVQGDIRALELPRFDLVSCLQVLEHVDDPAAFARRLLAIGRLVLVSVPHRWPRGTPGHRHDPVTLRKLERWFGRRANYHVLVREPFLGAKGERLLALFDADPARHFGTATRRHRR